MAEVKKRNVQTHSTHPQLVGDALELKAADENECYIACDLSDSFKES